MPCADWVVEIPSDSPIRTVGVIIKGYEGEGVLLGTGGNRYTGV